MDDVRIPFEVIERLEKGHQVDSHEMADILRMAKGHIQKYRDQVVSLEEINRDCFRRLASHAHAWEMLKVIMVYADDPEALKQVHDLLRMMLGIGA